MQDVVRGKAEEIKGKVTGDKVLQVKGKARQKIGGVKKAAKSMAYDMEHPPQKATRKVRFTEGSPGVNSQGVLR